MPTFVIIEFVRDISRLEHVERREKRALKWKTLHAIGDSLRLNTVEARKCVQERYAVYVR